MTIASDRRTQSERKKESEERLIRGAIDIIARQGTASLTFEAIGRKSGMSRGSITQRFGSKQGLIEAILMYLHDNQQSRMEEWGMDGLTGIDAIAAYIDLSLTRMAQTSDARAYFLLLSLSLNESGGPRSIFRETHAEVEKQVESWIREGQASGTISAEVEPASTALMLGCILFGVSMQFLTDPDMNIWPVREAVMQTVRKSLAP